MTEGGPLGLPEWVHGETPTWSRWRSMDERIDYRVSVEAAGIRLEDEDEVGSDVLAAVHYAEFLLGCVYQTGGRRYV